MIAIVATTLFLTECFLGRALKTQGYVAPVEEHAQQVLSTIDIERKSFEEKQRKRIDLIRGPTKKSTSKHNFKFEKFLPTIMSKDTFFIQVGASCGTDRCGVNGDPVWKYADKHGWAGAVVEPNPDAFKHLARNYRLNSRVRPFSFAVTNVSGSTDLWCPDKDFTEMCTVNEHWAKNAGFAWKVRVPSKPLSHIWRELKPSKVDLLLVDVEGAEDRVFQAPLPKPLPKLIMMENAGLWSKRVNPNGVNKYVELVNSLNRQGYRKVGLTPCDDLYQLNTTLAGEVYNSECNDCGTMSAA